MTRHCVESSPGSRPYFGLWECAIVVGELAGWSLERCQAEANRQFQWCRTQPHLAVFWDSALSRERFDEADDLAFRHTVFLPTIVRMCREAGIMDRLFDALQNARVVNGALPSPFGRPDLLRRLGAALASIDSDELPIVLRVAVRTGALAAGEMAETDEEIARSVGLSVDEVRAIYQRAIALLTRDFRIG